MLLSDDTAAAAAAAAVEGTIEYCYLLKAVGKKLTKDSDWTNEQGYTNIICI